MILATIIFPARNEEAFIAKAIDSVLDQIRGRDDIEIVVADGMSTDRTREIILGYAQRDPRVRLLENPGRTPPCGLNLAIRQAKGRIILRMDCHSLYPPNYVQGNIELLEATGAECVGGYLTTLPGAETSVARAIAAALSSAFGVGGCRSRTGGGKEEESDEATFGCFPRELFDRIGLFDERLTRNQDMEFFCRIRSKGGRIIISPKINVSYYARPDLGSFSRQAFDNGLWGAYTLHLIGGGLRPRHLIPLAFVLSLAALALGGLAWPPIWIALGIETAIYLAAGAFMAVKAAKKTDASPALILLVFILLHVSYGVGTLSGLILAPFRFGFVRKGSQARLPGDNPL